jgi:putative SOS response-associated peptidase YedK
MGLRTDGSRGALENLQRERSRGCLVPADWFYEWKKIDEKTKQPHAIAMKNGELFAFAGVWDAWKNKATGEELQTFTILTTNPNALMESIHTRMPVIVAKKDYERWLGPCDPARLPVEMLRPFDADAMTAWKVSRAVGNPRNNSPELVEALRENEACSLLPFME